MTTINTSRPSLKPFYLTRFNRNNIVDCVRLVIAPDGRWYPPSELRLVTIDLDQWHEGCPWPENAILCDEDLETVLQSWPQDH